MKLKSRRQGCIFAHCATLLLILESLGRRMRMIESFFYVNIVIVIFLCMFVIVKFS